MRADEGGCLVVMGMWSHAENGIMMKLVSGWRSTEDLVLIAAVVVEKEMKTYF